MGILCHRGGCVFLTSLLPVEKFSTPKRLVLHIHLRWAIADGEGGLVKLFKQTKSEHLKMHIAGMVGTLYCGA